MGKVFKALNKAQSNVVNEVAQQEEKVGSVSAASGPELKRPVASARSQTAESTTRPVTVPRQENKGAPLPHKTVPASFVARNEAAAPLDNTARGWDERLVTAFGTASAVSEEFRRLRTHILHPPNGGPPPRTILVTSVLPQEGKTFVCGGLGVALAQGVKEHVLMIDCDLRRPFLATLFGQDNEQGLADHLGSGMELGGMIRKTGLGKLSLVPAGPPPTNPAELLGSEELVAMIREAKERYADRYILLDSPPLQQAAETAILARLVDGVVLVVREGRSRREAVARFVNNIGPEKIVGVVFNAYESNLLERSLYGSYGGAYHYSSYTAETR